MKKIFLLTLFSILSFLTSHIQAMKTINPNLISKPKTIDNIPEYFARIANVLNQQKENWNPTYKWCKTIGYRKEDFQIGEIFPVLELNTKDVLKEKNWFIKDLHDSICLLKNNQQAPLYRLKWAYENVIDKLKEEWKEIKFESIKINITLVIGTKYFFSVGNFLNIDPNECFIFSKKSTIKGEGYLLYYLASMFGYNDTVDVIEERGEIFLFVNKSLFRKFQSVFKLKIKNNFY